MKRKWEEPRIEIQKFEANEYVAACYYFGGTHIILRVARPGTDGRTDPYDTSWQGTQCGFSDDGWDFLSQGDEDNIAGRGMPSGWYSTSNSHDFIVSGAPTRYNGGPFGNSKITNVNTGWTGDYASPVYYYGSDVYPLTTEIAEEQGVGPNAS